MIYELYLEGRLADIRQDLGMQLSYAIDDVNKYGSRETSFSKTIVLPGTANNNRLLGFISELGSNNTYTFGAANINSNFNPSQTTKAELRANGLLLLKGVFRLTGIVKDGELIEYEGNLFGELGGFIATIGDKKLQDLSFSEYNHNYTYNNIVNSWNTINGSGYYYPLIDYGTYSDQKINYDYRTFRPALYVKEYIDKMFLPTGYTYESSFFNSSFFKKLIIPNNTAQLQKFVNKLLDVESPNTFTITASGGVVNDTHEFQIINLIDNFTGDGDPNFTYTGSTAEVKIDFVLKGNFVVSFTGGAIYVQLYKNNNLLFENKYESFFNPFNEGYGEIYYSNNIDLTNTDTISLQFIVSAAGTSTFTSQFISLKIESTTPVAAPLELNDNILFSDIIPRNILQKDFFTWILKMFNLYVTEDKLREKHLLIEPYKDYYDLSEYVDWTYKVARDKPWNIKPMGMLNGRFFEYKYKEDNDFYNENFKKKYNLPYGSILQDTEFQFAKDKQTTDIGFSPTVLIQYEGTAQRTKVLPAIYKKSKGNAVDQEERTDSNIRILMAKKITLDVASWNIIDTGVNQTFPGTPLGAALTSYGYAGHFDDPINPTVDINFGASEEIYFDPNVYPTDNLFNTYWSGYIGEIADKDSKLLTCHVYLTELDIAQLDFSKPVFIDGVLWRINKIINFDASSGELTKVELLKIIDTSYPCAIGWTKTNYTGTTFRNGDIIPQVTDQTAWANLTTPAWCYYDNNSANDSIYGKLYNWYAVNDPRGFAPDGYRVPTDADWDVLVNCLGGESVAGGKMKSTSLWNAPNTGATNESLFNGFPNGVRFNSGFFGFIGDYGEWWSSTESSTSNAFLRSLGTGSSAIERINFNKNYGLSVRLIKE